MFIYSMLLIKIEWLSHCNGYVISYFLPYRPTLITEFISREKKRFFSIITEPFHMNKITTVPF